MPPPRPRPCYLTSTLLPFLPSECRRALRRWSTPRTATTTPASPSPRQAPLALRHLNYALPLCFPHTQTGFAALVNPENGYNYAGTPNLKALIYDPYAPAGRRYTEFATTNVMRLYHSTACLHRTGEIVVAGCETCSGYVSGAVG